MIIKGLATHIISHDGNYYLRLSETCWFVGVGNDYIAIYEEVPALEEAFQKELNK